MIVKRPFLFLPSFIPQTDATTPDFISVIVSARARDVEWTAAFRAGNARSHAVPFLPA